MMHNRISSVYSIYSTKESWGLRAKPMRHRPGAPQGDVGQMDETHAAGQRWRDTWARKCRHIAALAEKSGHEWK